MKIESYYASYLTCGQCALKTQCTTGKERRVRRWEHEGVLDAMQDRLDRNPGKMKQRRCTAYSDEICHRFQSNVGHFLQRKRCHSVHSKPSQSFRSMVGH